jgi:hypothetical protein
VASDGACRRHPPLAMSVGSGTPVFCTPRTGGKAGRALTSGWCQKRPPASIGFAPLDPRAVLGLSRRGLKTPVHPARSSRRPALTGPCAWRVPAPAGRDALNTLVQVAPVTAEVLDNPEHMLQSQAGYIDARPHPPESTKPLAPHGRTIHVGSKAKGSGGANIFRSSPETGHRWFTSVSMPSSSHARRVPQ